MFLFFFQAEDGIRDRNVTGVQTCALPIFPIGAANLEAFLEPGNSLADVRRFILNNSLFHLGNGTVRGWLRYSRHPERAAAGRSSQMQVDFDSLDLDQVVHAVAPQAHRTPG